MLGEGSIERMEAGEAAHTKKPPDDELNFVVLDILATHGGLDSGQLREIAGKEPYKCMYLTDKMKMAGRLAALRKKVLIIPHGVGYAITEDGMKLREFLKNKLGGEQGIKLDHEGFLKEVEKRERGDEVSQKAFYWRFKKSGGIWIPKVIIGDVRKVVKYLPDNFIDCVITSPPYWMQRDYKHPDQIGREEKLEEYVKEVATIFENLRPKLKKTATVFLNVGYRYLNGEFLLIPEMIALEMKGRGFTLKNKIIWCLDGKTPMMARINDKIWIGTLEELSKLDERIYLPTSNRGESTWVEVENIWKSQDTEGYRVTLTNGLSFIANANHLFPMTRNSRRAKSYLKIKTKPLSQVEKGDKFLLAVRFPYLKSVENELSYEDGFAVGFYIAEGNLIKKNRQNKGTQFSLYALKRWSKLKGYSSIKEYLEKRGDIVGIELSCGLKDKPHLEKIAKKFSLKIYQYGNDLAVRSYDKQFLSLIKQFCVGADSHSKHLNIDAYSHGLEFLRGILDGFLSGDGYYEEENDRWRVKMTAHNAEVINQVILLCRFLGYEFRLHDRYETTNSVGFTVKKKAPPNPYKDLAFQAVRRIEKVENVQLYEVSVKPAYGTYCRKSRIEGRTKQSRFDKWNDLFFIGNGVLTHNCKPNAMPTPARDRFNDVYEPVFFFIRDDGKEVHYFNLEEVSEKPKTLDKYIRLLSIHPKDLLGVKVVDPLSVREGREGKVVGVRFTSNNPIEVYIRWKDNVEEWISFGEPLRSYPEKVSFTCPLCKGVINYWNMMLSFANLGKLVCPVCEASLCEGSEAFPIPEFGDVVKQPKAEVHEITDFHAEAKKYITKVPKSSKFLKAKMDEVSTASPAGRIAIGGEYLTIKRRWDSPQPLICEYLRYWREHRGVTVNDVDKELGYTYTSGHWFRRDFGWWGRGGSTPRPGDWARLKDFLKFNDVYDRLVTEKVAVLQTVKPHEGGRNPGDVWEIMLEQYPEAHFSIFPTKLVEIAMKVGCPPEGVVLDPFAGSGTVAEVALKLGRRAIMVELIPQFLELMKKRCQGRIEVFHLNSMERN